MARMIPSVISPEVKSNAEKKVFEWFKNAPNTEDWVVLHSLGISNHSKVIHGETDFFILVPYKGIFALEVKGGRVTRNDGIWSFSDKYGNTGTKERGPFDQAWDGIFSIINDIKSKLDNSHQHLADIFYGIGVLFPDVEYQTVGCDEEQWQVFDSNDGIDVVGFINRIFDGACDRWKSVYGYDVPFNKLPTSDDVNYIASLLRGDFDFVVSISSQIRYSEQELMQLTQEQYRCIDQLEDNKRCLIQGGAGTGKTLLAIEEAKKSAAKGLKVALFCYNKTLGSWLNEYFSGVPQSLRPEFVGTFHSYMLSIIKSAGVFIKYPDNGDDYFYRHNVPTTAKIAFLQCPDLRFDKIIVDESQDLISPDYLNALDACLKGGLIHGQWTLFGDFSNQAIYNHEYSGDDMKNLLEERTSYIRFRLTINCRNTKPICEEITTITGFQPPSDVWSQVEGVPVQYLTYASTDEGVSKIEDVLHSLIQNHIAPKKITVLSPLKRENSIVDCVKNYDIRDYKVYGSNKITFSTVHSFKGLENSIILLTDISSFSDSQLMYVALSRARNALYIFETNVAKEEYYKLQLRRIQDGYKA